MVFDIMAIRNTFNDKIAKLQQKVLLMKQLICSCRTGNITKIVFYVHKIFFAASNDQQCLNEQNEVIMGRKKDIFPTSMKVIYHS